MNLLAHALIAHASLPEDGGLTLTGAVMADFFGGQRLEAYPAALARGIRQHRAVDDFTDRHAAFRGLCARLDSGGAPRLTAGILLDLFWDYVLGSRWEEFGAPRCGLELAAFCALANRQLERTAAHHSPVFRRVLPWLTGENWLAAYATRGGIAATLQGLSRRLTEGAALVGCERFLDSHGGELAAGFAAFWPELWGFVRGNPALWAAAD
jgi:acyl carrier protein phosphodiesterase